MRHLLVRFFRFCVRLFYRRVEVAGLENIPRDTAVIFAVNHPNGLVDPLFVLSYAPLDVSFLAKAPLFRYPLIGWFARAFDSIPVYRKQDNTSGSNRETFARAREVLARGGGIAIFPEGTTHSDARLRELKTGAARIALGATIDKLAIVPAGIYYSAKGTFRSDAFVRFGKPLFVRAEAVDASGEPSAEAVERLTSDIERALAEVTLQADSSAALDLVEQAEEIFSDTTGVAVEFERRKLFVEGYHYLCEHDRERLARLESSVRQFVAEMGRAKLEAHELVPRFRASTIARIVPQLPLAAAGALLHYPTYRLVGALAKRFSKGESELMATMKFVGALLLFPLTWIAYAAIVDHYLGWLAALIALIAIPLLGYAAMRVFETADVLIGRLRALRRRDLAAEREAIRKEFVAVAEEMGRATG
jgi:glycerol-3-phosphate O-acyltransferase/dihydroxyacetone phosphate acyltransferase